MNNPKKLKICNLSLLALTVIVLVSGIQLEVLGGSGCAWVWFHVAVCIAFMALCFLHIFLHFRKSNWFSRIASQKSALTKWLWWTAMLTLITGIAATVRWAVTAAHGPVGAIHGKIGFLMIILAAVHAWQRRKFFLKR